MTKRIASVLISLVAFVLVAGVVTAAPSAPNAPSLRWVTTSATTAEIRADGLTNEGQANNGATAWDIYFRFPSSVTAPYPQISFVPGPQFSQLCGFSTNITQDGLPGTPPSPTGGVIINGVCTSGSLTTGVTGDDVLVATLTFASCPTGLPQGFVMDMASGIDVFGGEVTNIVYRVTPAQYLPDSSLTDGAPMCSSPTAVTMTGLDAASSSAAPFAAAAWPLLAGAAAVAAGGAYALLRRKS